MKIAILVLMLALLSSCAMRVHVCFETESVSVCDSCKKKPILSSRPQDERPEKPIKVIDYPFTRSYAA